MSKSVSKLPAKAEAKGNKKNVVLAYLQSVANLIKAKQATGIVVLLFALGLGFYLDGSAALGSGSFAMLYLIADNGKKSGRADGNVYMRNGRIRGFVVPALVQNGFTTPARALLASLSSAWNSLTDADRASWNTITWLFKSNRFGQSKLVKGKQAYVMLNANLTQSGGTILTDAPAGGLGTPSITSGSLGMAQTGATMVINFAPSPTDADVVHLVFMTKPMNPGISRPRSSDFRWLANPGLSNTFFLGAGATTGSSFKLAYEEKFGTAWQTTPYNGKKVFALLKPINQTTGEEGGNIVIEGTIAI